MFHSIFYTSLFPLDVYILYFISYFIFCILYFIFNFSHFMFYLVFHTPYFTYNNSYSCFTFSIQYLVYHNSYFRFSFSYFIIRRSCFVFHIPISLFTFHISNFICYFAYFVFTYFVSCIPYFFIIRSKILTFLFDLCIYYNLQQQFSAIYFFYWVQLSGTYNNNSNKEICILAKLSVIYQHHIGSRLIISFISCNGLHLNRRVIQQRDLHITLLLCSLTNCLLLLLYLVCEFTKIFSLHKISKFLCKFSHFHMTDKNLNIIS